MSLEDQLTTLREARRLVETGRVAKAAAYLSHCPQTQIDASPTLLLLYGTAKARLGEHDCGDRMAKSALEKARQRGDRHVEARALNVLGVIRLETGRIEESVRFFESTLAVVGENGDHATLGRCCNNLGIVEGQRGRFTYAITASTRAVTAFRQAGSIRGEAEAYHNLAIAYRHLGDYERAIESIEEALRIARFVEDQALVAWNRAARAEIRVMMGETKLAVVDIEAALTVHRRLNDVIAEAEDLAVLAAVYIADEREEEAEAFLQESIAKGLTLDRPLLAGRAGRELAGLLIRQGRRAEAMEAAQLARCHLEPLGAVYEIKLLDELIERVA